MVRFNSDDSTALRAACVCECIFAVAAAARTQMIETIAWPRELSTKEQVAIEHILQCVYLCQAQRIFWERTATTNDDAELFEQQLFTYFQCRTKTDPLPVIREYIGAIESLGPEYEIKYAGMKMCKHLSFDDASLVFHLAMAFSSSMPDFLQQLKQISTLSTDRMKELLS